MLTNMLWFFCLIVILTSRSAMFVSVILQAVIRRRIRYNGPGWILASLWINWKYSQQYSLRTWRWVSTHWVSGYSEEYAKKISVNTTNSKKCAATKTYAESADFRRFASAVLLCPDDHYRLIIWALGPYIADYPEQILLCCIVKGWCPKYVVSLQSSCFYADPFVLQMRSAIWTTGWRGLWAALTASYRLPVYKVWDGRTVCELRHNWRHNRMCFICCYYYAMFT
jgi:hypothetical protein